MYSKILMPLDLEHADKMTKAIATAAELAKAHNSQLTMMSVTGRAPNAVAHDPAEYKRKLVAFVDAQAARYGIAINAVERESVDVAAELPQILGSEAEAHGYDLIVMASHVPGLMDHVFSSNACHIASYSALSVFVVRG